MKSSRRKLFLALGRRADVLGWVLTLWPISFFLYEEILREGIGNLTAIEALAYGLPALSLPVLGHLLKKLLIYQQDLGATRTYLENILDHMGDMLVIIDRDMRIVFGNSLLKQYFGQVIGRPCHEVLHENKDCGTLCPGEECFQTGVGHLTPHRWIMVDGEKRWFDINVSPMRDEEGKVTNLIELWRDVTAQVSLEEKLREQALTDSLTKLRNSRYFFQHFTREMQRAVRQRYPLALVMLDVDGFKQYNDLHGHLAGDKVLQRLGWIIAESIRKDIDIGCRRGGDEFSLVLPHLDLEEARKVVERISAEFLREGFPLVSLSAGIIMASQEATEEEMVESADRAMYAAKQAGGNRINVTGA